jgi:chromobox protein 1
LGDFPTSNHHEQKRVKEYEVEKVIDDRIRKGKQEFLVKWKGYPSEENTWEPYNNLKDNQQFKNYQKKMKKKK